MEFLNGLLTGLAASLFFWPLVVVAFVWLAYAVDNGKGGQTLFTTVVVLGLAYLKWPELGTFVKEHLLWSIVIYLAAGTVWSLIKWMIFTNKHLERFRIVKDEYSRINHLGQSYFKGSPEQSHIQGLAKALSNSSYFRSFDWNGVDSIQKVLDRVTPQASKSRYPLFTWGLYWPASVVWFLVADALTALGEFMYARFGKLFQTIANSMAKKAL